MTILEFIQTGIRTITDSAIESRNYNIPSGDGFERDRRKLAGDVKMVGKDIKGAIDQYGSKQSYKRPSA